MSYSISLEIDTGNGKVAYAGKDWNYTYNIAHMVRESKLGTLRNLHGKRAGDSVNELKAAWKEMTDDPERFKKHNPANGWGDYDSFVPILREMAEEAEGHPNCVWRIT